jgi:hypothetical protein
MITNNGKQIIAKYLIGQTPSFASHIAVGCGRKPLRHVNVGITNIEIVNGVAFVTTDVEHGFANGQLLTISGTYLPNESNSLNGNFVVLDALSSESLSGTIWNRFSINAPSGFSDDDVPQFSSFARAMVNFESQEDLEFEMFRVPISSRGYVTENGVSKIVFTAELPTEERYGMSEIGVFSAGANPSAGIYDSRVLYSFVESENWEYHSQSSSTSIPSKTAPLDAGGSTDVISVTEPVFQTTSDNRIFTSTDRINRNEVGRFVNNTILMAGDTAKLVVENDDTLSLDSQYSSTHIHLDGISTDFNKQSPKDELRLAFSVVNKIGGNESAIPSQVLMLLEFSSGHGLDSSSAKFEVNMEHLSLKNHTNNFNTNRYFVVKKELQDLIKTQDFSWDSVTLLKIYACVLDSEGEPSPNYYVALDGLRLENKASINPLYGLTGYSVIANQTERAIIKEQNTTNYVEFRTNIGIS